ncbi:MAG: amidohydrolase family protein, partial [Candidatus Dormiibacterota bacterium]
MIRAVHADGLLDPASGETTRDAVVVIQDGKVTVAGPRSATHVPRDAETVDASGLTVLPGLIDCHVHLTNLGEGLDFARELTTPPTLELMRAVRAARRTIDAGFTT